MKKSIHTMVVLIFLLILPIHSQEHIVIENETVTGTRTEEAETSITIKPTTHITSGANFWAKIISNTYIPLSLSNEENYILTRDFQRATTNGAVNSENNVTENIVYYDGLGRAIQSIGIKQSTNFKDVVTHFEYDGFGRLAKEHLPYGSDASNGMLKNNASFATNAYYNTYYASDINATNPNPYAEKEFERSPLNRIVKQAAPGYDWRLGGGHEIRYGYDINTVDEVLEYFVTTELNGKTYVPTLGLKSTGSYYTKGNVFKTVVKDENHNGSGSKLHISEEFKNVEGQVLLKRTYALVGSMEEAHDTYYVYDDYGNLTYVLPPKASERIIKETPNNSFNDYELYINQEEFTQANGGGSVKVSIKNNVLNIDFSGSFVSTQINHSGYSLGAIGCPWPNLNLGYLNTNATSTSYSVKIEDGKLKIINHSGHSISYFSGSFSVNLPTCSNGVRRELEYSVLDELCYQYKYDARNRLVEKKIPGKGKEYIVYDKLNRPVLTQDANLRGTNKWLFTKYDVLGRIIYTGIYTHGILLTQEQMQSHFDSQNTTTINYYEDKLTTAGNLNIYYSNNDFPVLNVEVLTVNYYDNYTFDLAGATTSVSTAYGVNSTTRLKGLTTGSKVKVLETNNWITTVTYYDEKARPIYVYSKNEELQTTDIVENDLDFVGKVDETKTTHKKIGKADIVTVDSFSYDHSGRLKSQRQKINNQATEAIVTNTYDELGQLESKKLGGNLQTVDYTYNIRGWLKNINQDTKNDNDLFNFSLKYNNPTIGTALYNGNISQTSWNTLNTDTSSKTYTYSYDALNRIISAIDNTTDKRYSLSNVTYDKNGNILSLIRKGHLDNETSPAYGIMDNLVYNYGTENGNKLFRVTDSGAAPIGVKGQFQDRNTSGDDYTYDANGNMKKDLNKNITSISYNHLNLPTLVTIGGQQINYVYDAAGTKLKKVVGSTTTEYAGNYIYENGSFQFFNHPEGYVKVDNVTSSAVEMSYVYQYKDHLGNIRLSYADSNNDGVITSSTEIIEESNYYPFGLKHKGYNGNYNPIGNAKAQKWGYNGKEYQDDLAGGSNLNWHDFGARNYDATLGRWMNLDPKAELMHNQGLYNYSFNSPILFVDPDGQLPWPITIRSFISAPSVGGGTFRGDGRGPNTESSPASTSRVESNFTVDPAKGTITDVSTRSDDTVFYGLPGTSLSPPIDPIVVTPEPHVSADVAFTNPNMRDDINLATGKGIGVSFKHSAKDPVTPSMVTPDLDVQANLTIVENEDKGTLTIAGAITGDAFPSTDAFVTDQSGNKVLLGAHKEKNGLGMLFMENKREVFSVNIQISFDKKGNFIGVTQGDKNYSVEAWNKRVKKLFNN